MRKYTAEEIDLLRAHLRYETDSGKFFWTNPRGTKVRVGDEAGTVSSGFYKTILFNGKGYRCHRLAYAWMHGEFDGSIEHIDGDVQNNAISNLRLAPRQKHKATGSPQMPRPISAQMIADLKSYLHYDPETGKFIYTKNRVRKRSGEEAGKTDSRGYRCIKYDGSWWLAHRIAYAWDKNGLTSDLQIDHINGVTTDNRLFNLRLATPAQNRANNKSITSNSGIKGVHFDERFQCYRAQVMIERRPVYAHFKKEIEAEAWVRKTRESLHKQFANHGEPT